MQALVLNPTQVAQWHALIDEAQKSTHHDLGEELESYLVFLLIRFTTQPDLANRILALDYLESMQQHGKRRINALKNVGDHCLLFSGLFPQRAKHRQVKLSYFINLGRSAYQELSNNTRPSTTSLFNALSLHFIALMDTLHSIRALGNTPCLDPLQAYELWRDTGSEYALKTLSQKGDPCPVAILDNDPSIRH